jgi:molybdate transport system substrate-binding protein
MANAVEIKIMSSNAMREALLELFPMFERETGQKPMPTFVGGVDIMKRMAAGEICDLVIMSGPQIDQLIGQGKIKAGSRVDLVRSGIGVAVRAGAPRPDISSAEAIKRALLAAKSITYSSGPSGVYLANLFAKMGIADALKDKIKPVPPGVPAGSFVARGEAEIGFQQISELLPVQGIDLGRTATRRHPGDHGVFRRHPCRRRTHGGGQVADGVHHLAGGLPRHQEKGARPGLARIPEKWAPVFRKGYAPLKRFGAAPPRSPPTRHQARPTPGIPWFAAGRA